MEKAKISPKQLFVVVVLFEMGSAILVGLASSAKQDAWISILLGMLAGILLFLVYHRLFLFYPDLPLTSYIQKIVGKWVGRTLALMYIVYFIYLAGRVLRDFGELLTSTIYTNTPMVFLITVLLVTIAYAIHKGFEVIARVGEIFFGVVYLMAIVGFFLIIFSGLIHLENLRPMLENGIVTILKTTMRETLTFPFGEMIVFTMLLPYLNKPKKARMMCILGMVLSGVNITIASIVNIATLGVDLFVRAPYPLLATVGKIQLAQFIERLDVLFMLYLMIAGFIKVAIFYYAAVIGTADLFQFKNYRKISLPIGMIVLLAAIVMAQNYMEHIKEGLQVVPIFLHWPFQIIIPVTLLGIAYIREKLKQKKSQGVTQTSDGADI
jgi:spore germination protein KB